MWPEFQKYWKRIIESLLQYLHRKPVQGVVKYLTPIKMQNEKAGMLLINSRQHISVLITSEVD
jgi:hypothetical protein